MWSYQLWSHGAKSNKTNIIILMAHSAVLLLIYLSFTVSSISFQEVSRTVHTVQVISGGQRTLSCCVRAVGSLHGGGRGPGGGLCLLQAPGVQLQSTAQDLPAAEMQRAHCPMQGGETAFMFLKRCHSIHWRWHVEFLVCLLAKMRCVYPWGLLNGFPLSYSICLRPCLFTRSLLLPCLLLPYCCFPGEMQ